MPVLPAMILVPDRSHPQSASSFDYRYVLYYSHFIMYVEPGAAPGTCHGWNSLSKVQGYRRLHECVPLPQRVPIRSSEWSLSNTTLRVSMLPKSHPHISISD
jgi:hypothetical protein